MSAEISDDLLSALLTYSVRYALGRRTYACSQVARAVIDYRGHLQPGDRQAILKDFDECGPEDLGDDCDAVNWRAMARALREPPEPSRECPECGGDGSNGYGRTCGICHGTGKRGET